MTGTHKAKEADQHSPLAHTPALGELSAELSALPTPGSPAAEPPPSVELPLSSSGGWRPPEEVQAQRALQSGHKKLTSQGPSIPPHELWGERSLLPCGRDGYEFWG